MKFKVFERLVLLNILPKEGNFITLKIIRKLQENLSFSEKEIKELKITLDPEKGNASWDASKDESKDIEIGEEAKKIIAGALEKLDKDEKLTQEHFTLFEKFVGSNGKEK